MNAHDDEIRRLENIALLMDSQFLIPGTSIRFGLDSLIGLIPGFGDTATILITLYIAERARRLNVPRHIRARMYINAAIDWLIGIVPFLGDIFDVGWKANLRNVALIRDHLRQRA